MSNDKNQTPEVDVNALYAEAVSTTTGKAAKALPPNVQAVAEAGNTFAKVLTRKAQGAQPDSQRPFAVYQRRDNASPRLPDRKSAEAVMHFTAKSYRKIGGPSIRLKVVQLPGSDYAVFAFKSGTKRRFTLGAEPITC